MSEGNKSSADLGEGIRTSSAEKILMLVKGGGAPTRNHIYMTYSGVRAWWYPNLCPVDRFRC